MRELAPKQHININLKAFMRTDPLLEPCFMHLDARISSFYVPMEMIWTKFNEFIAQSVRNGSVPTSVPTIREAVLAKALISLLDQEDKNAESNDHDWYYIDNSGSDPDVIQYIKFKSRRARILVSTLDTLGYRLQGGLDPYNVSTTGNRSGTIFSALPLLAWSKCWFDYFRIDSPNMFPFEPDQGAVTLQDCQSILGRMSSMPIAFAKDYFCHNETPDAAGYTNFHASTTAMKPTLTTADLDTLGTEEQNNGTAVGLQFNTIGGVASTTTPAGNHGVSPNLQVPGENDASITSLALNQLGRLTDYVKRISVSGLTAFKRILNEYGISTTDTPTTKVAEFIGDYIFNLNGQQVTNQAENGESSPLGKQSVSSIQGGGDMYLSYTAEKFGYLMMFLNVRPKTEFVEGRPRYVQHIKPLHFYHADFDNFGYQATRVDELITPKARYYDEDGENKLTFIEKNTTTLQKWANGSCVEGVLPTYAEYKVGESRVTGDFARWSLRNTMNRYHLARYLRPCDDGSNNLPNSGDLLRITNTWSTPEDYLRVFANGTNYDPFICHFDFLASISAPMRGLFDLPGTWEAANTGAGVRGTSNPDKFAHI